MSTFFRLLFGRQMKAFAGIPGPTPSLPLGNGGDFSSTGDEPWLTFREYVRAYGELVLIWFGGSPRLLVGSPELLEEVLGQHSDRFYKKDPVSALLPILSDSAPFLANGSQWRGLAERDLPNMPGVDLWLASQSSVVQTTARRRVEDLIESPAVWSDATSVIRALGFEAFARMAIGAPLPAIALAELLALARCGTERMDAMLPVKKTVPAEARKDRERWLNRFREAVAEARRELPESRIDMLATTLRQGPKLDDEGLALALSNLFFGGMFSSSTALLTCLWHLTRHPELRAELVREVRPIICANHEVSWAQLDALPFLDQCVREALRVDAPVPVFMRNSNKDRDIKVGSYTIPRNTTLFISSWVMHRDARRWERPDDFDPHRWTDQVKADNPYGSGWFFPFGMGPRACSGQAFALLFIKSALAEIAGRFEFSIGADRPYKSTLFFAVQAPKNWDCSFAPLSPD